MATLGFAIVGVIVVNGVFSFWQVYRADRALAAMEQLLPHQVKVLRDGVYSQIPAAGLVPGDLISIEGGDLVPADCRLIESFGVRVNAATVTGESLPRSRDAHPSTKETFLHSRNALLAGESHMEFA
jgi:P-type E1-E2 ATPase